MKKLLVIACTLALMVSVSAGSMSLLSAADDTEKATIGWMASFSDLGAWTTSIHDGNTPMVQPMSNPSPHVKAKDVSADGYGATLYPGTVDSGALSGLQLTADFDTYTTLYVKGVYTGSKDSFRFSIHNGAKLNANWNDAATKKVGLLDSWKPTVQDDGSFYIEVDLSNSLDKDKVWLQIGWFLDQTNQSSIKLDYIALGTQTESADALAAAIASYKESPLKDALQMPANGQVAWVADFSRANWNNWTSDAHHNVNGQFKGTLHGSAMVKDPVDVSADGLSATLQDKASDIPGLMGYPVKAQFDVYTRLIVKGSYTGDFSKFRMGIHDGLYVTSDWGNAGDTPTAKKSKTDWNLTLNDDNTFFWVIDVGAEFAASDHMWVNWGWFLDNTSTIRIDYMALTTNNVTDDATASAAISKYLAGEQYEVPAPIASVSDSKTFEAAVDTEQAFISGAMRIELSASDFAKLQAAKNEVALTDGTHSLKWDLADYTLAQGKVNTLLLPFNEAVNASIFSRDDTKLDLTAVTGVSITARDYEGELTVKIGKVDFINFDELLDSVGIVFYDSCNVPSTSDHGVVGGEKGGAYSLSNDVDACDYINTGVADWARRFGAKGETFSFNASSRKKLNVEYRVKMSGAYNRFMLQLTSFAADGAFADQNWAIVFKPENSVHDFSDGEWITISSADEDDADAWSFGGDNVCDLTRLLDVRVLGFRQPATGASNTGSVLVDYVMITDSDRYEGMDNLYLYATAEADGSGYVCYYDTADDDNPGSSTPGDNSSVPDDNNSTSDNNSSASDNNSSDSDNNGSSAENPVTGAALPLTAFALLAAAAGTVVCCRKRK